VAGTTTREHAYLYDGDSNLTREQVTGSSVADAGLVSVLWVKFIAADRS
jgi:hypothetical protein